MSLICGFCCNVCVTNDYADVCQVCRRMLRVCTDDANCHDETCYACRLLADRPDLNSAQERQRAASELSVIDEFDMDEPQPMDVE